LPHDEIQIEEERWRHVLDRHPELKEMRETVADAISSPDDSFVDSQGAIHYLKRTDKGPSDYVVVVAKKKGRQVSLITAYCTNERRVQRRYRTFKRLARS
jgi:hypothetical protein